MKTQAIVIGGSMAGLLTARVLAHHFQHVTVIERDAAHQNEPRKGVPQGQHVHGILKAGIDNLEKLFPGIYQDLLAGGSTEIDFGADFCWLQDQVWKRRFQSGVNVIIQTRPFLEWQVQKRVAALPNVQFCYETAVTRLLTTADKSRVTGVELQRKDGVTETIAADLVVDAAGRGSRLPAWLETLGYSRPAESEVKIGLSYTSRFYTRKQLPHWKAIFILPKAPQEKRGSLIIPVEGDRWLISIMSYMEAEPPDSENRFLEVVREMYPEAVYQELKNAAPQSDIKVFKYPAQSRRHYEKLSRQPEGILAIGDAVCSFDPLFGQGMSVASQEAVALDDLLAKSDRLDGIAAHFYKAISLYIDPPWMLTSSEAFRYPETSGTKPPAVKLFHWYIDQIFALAVTDQVVYRAFIGVMHLLTSPAALFHPRIVARVIKRNLGMGKVVKSGRGVPPVPGIVHGR